MKQEVHLDRPFYTSSSSTWATFERGDWASYTTAQHVWKICQRFPATLELVLYGMLIAILLALPLGIAAAIGTGSTTWRVLSVLGVSVPISGSG